MGETMAEALRDQIEIEKPNTSEIGLRESISFGRFENDLLSWERWSSFSQNKYLEEVEKCSTPGSVAKKKAYFEAHYKKIGVRKTDTMDQEQEGRDDPFRSSAPGNGSPISNGCGTKLDFDKLGVDEVSRSVKPNDHSIDVADITENEEPKLDEVAENCHGSVVGSFREEVDDLIDSSKPVEFEGEIMVEDETQYIELIIIDNSSSRLPAQPEQLDVLVQEENDLSGQQDPIEQSHQNETSHDESNTKDDAKSRLQKEPQKINQRTLASKDGSLVKTKKKSVAPTAKTTHTSLPGASERDLSPSRKTTRRTSLPGASKPVSSFPILSAKRISTRRESSPSLLKKTTPVAVKNKTTPVAVKSKTTPVAVKSKTTPVAVKNKTTPMAVKNETTPLAVKSKTAPLAAKKKTPTPDSLHTSLSSEPAKSDLATPTTRRSFIMENMGDKDIVKRAFRAFQNNLSLSSPHTEEKSSTPHQASTSRTARVASTSMSTQKDKERVKKTVENISSQRKQLGAKVNSVSSGSVKGAGQRHTNAKISPSSFGLKSDERAEKQKEFSKKLQKSNDKEVEKAHLLSPPKEKKDAETERLSQGHNFKASPISNFHQKKISKIHGTKVGASDELLSAKSS